MPRAKRSLSEELKNQTEFVEGVLALVAKHFGRKKAVKKANGRAVRPIDYSEEIARDA